jgi:3'(2'), 5'-bisphosphate nucleotidase
MQTDIERLLNIVREAGQAIMEIYKSDFQHWKKDDRSPLTEADLKANEIILRELQKWYPQIPFISEESKHTAYHTRKKWPYFWLIDPLDGTKEFINKNKEFTVNIALISKTFPVAGVIYAPAKDVIYYALKDQGSFKIENDSKPSRIFARTLNNKKKIVIVGSKSHSNIHLEKYVEQKQMEYDEVEFISAGSSLKICLVAEGSADVYPRTGPTYEWDIAAGDIIVRESGKYIYNFKNENKMEYNKKNLLNDWFIVR